MKDCKLCNMGYCPSREKCNVEDKECPIVNKEECPLAKENEKVVVMIRVPGRMKNIEEILMENSKLDICLYYESMRQNGKYGKNCWMDADSLCQHECQDVTMWVLTEVKREPVWWNPMSWFMKYYYFSREQIPDDNMKQMANLDAAGVEYIKR